MRSRLLPSFLAELDKLPRDVRRQTGRTFKKFKRNPYHPSLQFKKVRNPYTYSARVNDDYRVMGIWRDDTITWFWVGKHSNYDKLI